MVVITSIETGRVDFTIVYGESLVILGIGAGIVGVNFEVG
jgi:hypothetical protein